MTTQKSASVANRLLGKIAPKQLASLWADFEEVPLTLRQDLSQPAGAITHVYFPLRGMISLVPTFNDGTMIEVGLVGKEGFLGVPVLLAGQASSISAVVQEEGTALRMKTDAFIKAVQRFDAFHSILLTYAQFLLLQVTQTAMCNGRHTLNQRLGRWLLEAHDRVEGEDISLSHALLSTMLGIRRAGVTTALGAYARQGLLDNTRPGVLRVRNRKGIEAAACECYRTLQRHARKLL